MEKETLFMKNLTLVGRGQDEQKVTTGSLAIPPWACWPSSFLTPFHDLDSLCRWQQGGQPSDVQIFHRIIKTSTDSGGHSACLGCAGWTIQTSVVALLVVPLHRRKYNLSVFLPINCLWTDTQYGMILSVSASKFFCHKRKLGGGGNNISSSALCQIFGAPLSD